MCRNLSFSEKLLKKEELSDRCWDEGGFAPNLPDAQAALAYIVRATEEPDIRQVRKYHWHLMWQQQNFMIEALRNMCSKGKVRQKITKSFGHQKS